jgi:sugar-specific transcriptional regulator TrmB
MKNLNIQLKKQESKEVTDSKSVVSAKYHDYLNVFSKKKIDVLSSHKKHDHRIKLKEEKTHEYVSLYNMFEDELLLIKKYLQEHLNKEFIESSTASYASFILFAKKFDEDLRFCVNYRKLNAIIKKNKYLIFLIAEIIARLFKVR